MTETTKPNRTSKILLLLGVLAVSSLFTLYSDEITASAKTALRLCALSVIPSLFPFIVLSSLASKAASHLTGRSSPTAAVILSFFLGALCGFPVGAAVIASMYKNKTLRKDFAEGLCGLCNNTGPAFTIGVIGNGFWGSAALGTMFYICQLLSASVIFGIWRYFVFPGRKISISANEKNEVAKRFPISANAAERFSASFCTSVSESAISVLQVCGYIVFFKVLCDTLLIFLPDSLISRYIYTVLTSLLEFTTGANSAAALGGRFGIAFCGFTVSFSGLSVMAQSAGILSGAGLSVKPLFVMKLFAGILSAVLAEAAYSIFDFNESRAAVFYADAPNSMIIISSAIAALSLLLYTVSFFIRKAKTS